MAEVEEEVDAEVLIKVHLKELLKLERCKYRMNMNYNLIILISNITKSDL